MKLPDNNGRPRHTGRGIVVWDDKLLLIERWRDGLHYFSIPGGGIEADETPAQTAEREIFEETSIRVQVRNLLYEVRAENEVIHYIFICDYISGHPVLRADSDEARDTALGFNRFKPLWLPLEALSKTPFVYWQRVAAELAVDIQNGFSEKAKVLVNTAER